MKIICAPDSFKESMTAAEAAASMAAGVRDALPDAQVDECPISDGGEGFTDAVAHALHGEFITTGVTDPIGKPVNAIWAMTCDDAQKPDAAVIEMAAASGLALAPPDQRDPTRTTTFGTGQLILAALEQCVRRITLGIGGSATCDGGCGTAQALGVKFFSANGKLITEPITGGMLADIHRIDIDHCNPRLADTPILVACDVTNPLTGPNGAAHIYGPQKGATPAQVEQLDANLRRLADLWRTQLDIDVEHTPGSGAAGGLGAGLMAFFGATLQSGIDLVLNLVRFNERVAGCDLCLTGEGRLDGQSLSGKACIAVAQRARAHGVPTIALVGSIGPDAQRTRDAGLHGYHVIGEGLSVEESIRRGPKLLRQTAKHVVELMARSR